MERRRLAYEVAHPGAFHTGGAVSEPHELTHIKFSFPEGARARLKSSLTAITVVSETGAVVDPVIISPLQALDASVLSVIRQWHFAPALQGNQPVPVFLTVHITPFFGP